MKMFDPSNAQLSNINDVKYYQDKILTALRRPKGFYGGFGEDVNRSILESNRKLTLDF